MYWIANYSHKVGQIYELLFQFQNSENHEVKKIWKELVEPNGLVEGPQEGFQRV